MMTDQTNRNASGMDHIRGVLAPYLIGLRHVGYLVEDMEHSLRHLQALYGNVAIARFPDPKADAEAAKAAGTWFAFVQVGGIELELIQAVSEPWLSLLEPSPCAGGGLNHLAWQVRDLEQAYADLQQAGMRAGHVTPSGIVQFGGRKMLYLDPTTTGGHLLELIESIPESQT